MDEQLRSSIQRAAAVLREMGAREVYLFGSAARGKLRPGSDVDLAVSGLPRGLFFRAMSAPPMVTTVKSSQVGQLMVFDDSVKHEAWNNSDADRLVLIFDVWRPELSADERRQVETLFAIVDSY